MYGAWSTSKVVETLLAAGVCKETITLEQKQLSASTINFRKCCG